MACPNYRNIFGHIESPASNRIAAFTLAFNNNKMSEKKNRIEREKRNKRLNTTCIYVWVFGQTSNKCGQTQKPHKTRKIQRIKMKLGFEWMVDNRNEMSFYHEMINQKKTGVGRPNQNTNWIKTTIWKHFGVLSMNARPKIANKAGTKRRNKLQVHMG